MVRQARLLFFEAIVADRRVAVIFLYNQALTHGNGM
jgi:hypothetical protein